MHGDLSPLPLYALMLRHMATSLFYMGVWFSAKIQENLVTLKSNSTTGSSIILRLQKQYLNVVNIEKSIELNVCGF
jgi:hypothetical protein